MIMIGRMPAWAATAAEMQDYLEHVGEQPGYEGRHNVVGKRAGTGGGRSILPEPDVLLIQETKLSDADAPEMPMRMLGYEMAHHGEGRWNGVAILSRVGITEVVTNFGDGPVRDSSAGSASTASEDDFNPFDEARMVSAVCGGVRVASLYAPNGREVGSPFYEGKLRWFSRLAPGI